MRFNVFMVRIRLRQRFYNWLHNSKNPLILKIYQSFKYIKKTVKRIVKKFKYFVVKTTYYYCIKPLWRYIFKPVQDSFIAPITFIVLQPIYVHMVEPLFTTTIKPICYSIFRSIESTYNYYGGTYLTNYVKRRLPGKKA